MEEVANENGEQTEKADISQIENHAGFMGTVCCAPQTQEFGSGKKTTVRIAVNERVFNTDDTPMINPETGEQITHTEFIEIQSWGKAGEKLAELSKPFADYMAARTAGDDTARAPRLWAEGEMKEARWEKDGKTHSKLILVAYDAGDMSTAKGHFVNRVVLKGNLVRDTDIKTFDDGGKITKNSLAVNKEYTKKNGEQVKEVSYFNLDATGKSADAMKDLNKGDYVQIDGKLRMDTWQTEKGKTRTALKIKPLKVNVISRVEEREARKSFAPKRSTQKSEDYSR